MRQRYTRFAFAPFYGLIGLRVNMVYWCFKAPWCIAPYSERYVDPPVWGKSEGWRITKRVLKP
jgi:hypothetical protein